MGTEAKEKKIKTDPETWLEDHGDYLYRYAFRYFGDETLAEELVQDTLLAGLKGYKNFKGQSTIRTWLTGIMKHKIIDRLRARKKEATTSLNMTDSPEDEFLGHLLNEKDHFDASLGFKEWGLEPTELIEQKEFLTCLNGCMQKLPEHARTIFMLKEVEGYSRKEIAEQLGISSTNAGVLLHRVRLSLRSCLEKNWFKKQ